MRVAELWRYPVKSLGGERLGEVDVFEDGFAGDRLLRVEDRAGRVLTARRAQRLIGLGVELGEGDGPLIEGLPWDSEAALAAVRAASRDQAARLVRTDSGKRFDDTPLLVATDGLAEAHGIDLRRLRPNLVVGDVDGLAEREWEGRTLRAGGAEIEVSHLCERCGVTTIDPDSQAVDPDVLRRLGDELGGMAALNCRVSRPGRIAVGDPVELL